MEYSVYIIQDRTKSNLSIFNGLAGDTKFADHLKNVGSGLANDLAGGDFVDQYATTEKLGENGVAINGEMINSVSIKPELVKKEILSNNTTEISRVLITTITVNGNLFAPSLIELKSKVVRNKNMARVLAWATLPQTRPSWSAKGYKDPIGVETNAGILLNFTEQFNYLDGENVTIDTANSYEGQYYRRVLVTFYSDKDTQFRATLYDRVYVLSYEEVYDDKDGNGHFTLVMQSVGTNVYDAFIAGPTYKFSGMALADQVTSTVNKYSKKTTKVVETFDKITDKHISDTIKPYMDKIDSGTETADSIRDDWTVDNVTDNVDTQAETYHPTDMKHTIEQASAYQQAYDGLTKEQQDTLKNIPGFKKMSLKEKLKYIEKLKG